MSYRIDAAIPSLLLDSLTYECSKDLPAGARVIVPVMKKLCVGFVLGRSEKLLPPSVKIKSVVRIIDRQSVIPADLWDLAEWSGHEDFCGMAVALASILPKNFLDGDEFSRVVTSRNAGSFKEIGFYYPYDYERNDFYVTELKKNERTLILFPTKESAQKFFRKLPAELKQEALLWPSTGGKKLCDSWNAALNHEIRIIIASQGGVFAPLSPEKIIIEDEANPAYIFKRSPRISARDFARHRAEFLGAKFIIAGSMPSLAAYIRTQTHESKLIPSRENIILTDINYSLNEEARGIDGNLPITFSLIRRTYRELSRGNDVIWILNRLGNSAEVYCENCGESIRCEKCGGLMRSENHGINLRCKSCGNVHNVPEKCPNCGYKFFRGRRPGLEAVYEAAGKYYKDIHIYSKYYSEDEEVTLKTGKLHGLILSSQKGLELCDKIDPALIAWLDLDSELWRPDYETHYKAFKSLWESYWRGRKNKSERKILIQSRKSGMKLAEYLSRGWEKFLVHELESRREFFLPPYSYMLELECQGNQVREEIADIFTEAGFIVMDPGTYKLPLQISVDDLEKVHGLIASSAVLQKALKKSLRITVRRD